MKLSFFDSARWIIHAHIVKSMRSQKIYPWLYISYWHSIFSFSKKHHNHGKLPYLTARPNPGAGIGHQMANWNAGFWWARQFDCLFAHIPFSSKKWEEFLGFGIGEATFSLLRLQGYKIRRLPLFDIENFTEKERTKKIIESYRSKKVILLCEQDQFYRDQYGVMDEIQTKFHSAALKRNDRFIWSDTTFNIVVHIRRGDIVKGMSTGNPNHLMRWLDNNYYRRVIDQILPTLKTNKPVHIYLFSQGNSRDYPEMENLPNLHWCLDMSPQESFLHMVNADLLVTSKSSFSYKPALLNQKGIKVCPRQFWHGYPDSHSWVLCENDGNIEKSELCKIDV